MLRARGARISIASSRHSRSTNGTAWIITTLAIAMIMTNVVGKIWGADPIVVNAPAPFSNDMLTWGSINISSYQIALIVLTVLLVVVVEVRLLRRR